MRSPEIQRRLAAVGFTSLPFVPPSMQRGTTAGSMKLTRLGDDGHADQVEYSPNLDDWFIAPAVFLTGSRAPLEWTDAAPPATDSNPARAPVRFYRVLR